MTQSETSSIFYATLNFGSKHKFGTILDVRNTAPYSIECSVNVYINAAQISNQLAFLQHKPQCSTKTKT